MLAVPLQVYQPFNGQTKKSKRGLNLYTDTQANNITFKIILINSFDTPLLLITFCKELTLLASQLKK
jgi:hypothetical protein